MSSDRARFMVARRDCKRSSFPGHACSRFDPVRSFRGLSGQLSVQRYRAKRRFISATSRRDAKSRCQDRMDCFSAAARRPSSRLAHGWLKKNIKHLLPRPNQLGFLTSNLELPSMRTLAPLRRRLFVSSTTSVLNPGHRRTYKELLAPLYSPFHSISSHPGPRHFSTCGSLRDTMDRYAKAHGEPAQSPVPKLCDAKTAPRKCQRSWRWSTDSFTDCGGQ